MLAFERDGTCHAMVEEIPRQGRLEGCHRVSVATHHIYRLKSM